MKLATSGTATVVLTLLGLLNYFNNLNKKTLEGKVFEFFNRVQIFSHKLFDFFFNWVPIDAFEISTYEKNVGIICLSIMISYLITMRLMWPQGMSIRKIIEFLAVTYLYILSFGFGTGWIDEWSVDGEAKTVLIFLLFYASAPIFANTMMSLKSNEGLSKNFWKIQSFFILNIAGSFLILLFIFLNGETLI